VSNKVLKIREKSYVFMAVEIGIYYRLKLHTIRGIYDRSFALYSDCGWQAVAQLGWQLLFQFDLHKECYPVAMTGCGNCF